MCQVTILRKLIACPFIYHQCFIDVLLYRYSVEQFATKSNDVISYLNITSVRSEDGGLFTCRAANSLGEVSHTSRLNIYGESGN